MKVSKFGFEAQLLRWTESSNGGATIVLQLQDADDLAIFKTMTLAKKGTVGQRLAVAIAEIDDNEKLVEHEVKPKAEKAIAQSAPEVEIKLVPAQEAKPKVASHFPGGFCGLAVQWCEDEQFREWLSMEFTEAWEKSATMVTMSHKNAEAERAAVVIKLECACTSRKELDTNEESHEMFEQAIRKPYMAYLKEGA